MVANEISHEKPPAWYEQLFHAFLTPFNGVLFAVSVVSLFTDVIFAAPEDRSFRTIIVLSAMVLLSTLLRFWQEFRSNQAAEELKAMVRSTTAVLRAGMAAPAGNADFRSRPGRHRPSVCRRHDPGRRAAS